MSYTNSTTHFQWPLPEETDLFNGLDDNQMKEDLDEKIYNLEQRSTGDHEAVAQLNERVTKVELTVGGYNDQIEQLQGIAGEHAERLVNLTNRQTELSRRLNGKAGESTIAPEYNKEESYLVGDFVYHNNILYKAKNASATPAGAFNADDWDIAILTNELGGSTPTPGTIAAANVSFDDAVARLGATNVQAALVALKTLVDKIGGGEMPLLNFASPLHTFSNNAKTYTATKECYLLGSMGTGSTESTISINGTVVFTVKNNSASVDSETQIPLTRLKAGDAVVISAMTVNTSNSLNIYEAL